MQKIIKRLFPASVKIFIRKIHIFILELLGRDLDYLYNEGFHDPYLDVTWPEEFYDIISGEFNPSSIIDFGCSFGNILSPFEKKGIEIFGLEGSKVAKKYLKIKQENFLLFDLRKPYKDNRKYDLCFCFEVAEHIKEKHSDTLIGSLA